MKVIALTGGVACGKTTVSDRLASKGFPVIDTDTIAHELLENDDAIREKVQATFGTSDRHQLRKIVFMDERQRSRLEQILHPPILHEVRLRLETLKRHKPKPPVAIVVIPLLFETEGEAEFDEIIAVVSQKKTQVDRLLLRDNISLALAEKMLSAQFPNQEKAARATHVIWNDGDKSSLFEKVDALSSLLLN